MKVARQKSPRFDEQVAQLIPFPLPPIQSSQLPVKKTSTDEPLSGFSGSEDFCIAVAQRLTEKQNLYVPQIEKDTISRIIEDVRRAVRDGVTINEAVDNNATVRRLCEITSEVINVIIAKTIFIDREYAIGRIDDDYGEIVKEWKENTNALTDATMSKYFERKDSKTAVDNLGNSFLTTYFDTAQFGLTNKLLDTEAGKKSMERGQFETYIASQLRQFIKFFTLLHSNNFSLTSSDGVPVNVIFEQNGTAAFRLFCREFIGNREKILRTSEEYVPMLKDSECLPADRIVSLPEYRTFPSYEHYRKAIEDKVSADNSIRYMLASFLGRRGTLFPIDSLHRLCKQLGIHLIVDTCQSFGRMHHKIPADIIIGSMRKGAELGDPSQGFLILSDAFIRGANATDKVANLSKPGLGGSYDPVNLARAVYASNPVQVGTLTGEGEDEVKSIGIMEREKITKGLSFRFAQLVQALNKKHNNRIEFFNDCLIYSGDKINEDQLSPIFECRIKGVNFKQVQTIARQYGVVINSYSDAWDDDASFRICFHPFMGNDSVKIIGRVLQECCQL
jgi:hypothetical protein